MVPANRVDASGWEGGESRSLCSLEKSRSMTKGIHLTGVVARHRRTSIWTEWKKGNGKKV